MHFFIKEKNSENKSQFGKWKHSEVKYWQVQHNETVIIALFQLYSLENAIEEKFPNGLCTNKCLIYKIYTTLC